MPFTVIHTWHSIVYFFHDLSITYPPELAEHTLISYLSLLYSYNIEQDINRLTNGPLIFLIAMTVINM